MLVLRSPEHVARIADPGIRRLVELRFSQVCDGELYDPDRHGYMVVVEPGDSAEVLEEAVGIPVVHDAFGETRFGEPDFVPSAEVIERHGSCFELAFVLDDDGYVIAIFVPKVDGVDPELLAMCRTYAVPATELSEP